MAPAIKSRARNWQQLVQHHQVLLDDFAETCAAPDAPQFLRYLCTVEAPSWRAPFAALSDPLPRGKARATEKSINKRGTTWEQSLPKKQKRTAADWMLLVRTRFGRQVEKPGRLLFFSALVPYMKWRRGSPDWQWLARFIAATEGRSPGNIDAAETTRAWWKKTLSQVQKDARSLVVEKSMSVAQQRKLQRHLLLSGSIDGAAWTFVRFLSSSRPASERTTLQGRYFHPKSIGREFVRRGLVPVFGGLRERRFTAQRIARLREDGLLSASDRVPDENWIELLPRVQHARQKRSRTPRRAYSR